VDFIARLPALAVRLGSADEEAGCGGVQPAVLAAVERGGVSSVHDSTKCGFGEIDFVAGAVSKVDAIVRRTGEDTATRAKA
jgi:hypothetical protein